MEAGGQWEIEEVKQKESGRAAQTHISGVGISPFHMGRVTNIGKKDSCDSPKCAGERD